MSSIDIKTAKNKYGTGSETEDEMLSKMAKEYRCHLIYKFANDYGDKTTHTDYEIIMTPGDEQEQALFDSSLVHNLVLVYEKDEKKVSKKIIPYLLILKQGQKPLNDVSYLQQVVNKLVPEALDNPEINFEVRFIKGSISQELAAAIAVRVFEDDIQSGDSDFIIKDYTDSNGDRVIALFSYRIISINNNESAINTENNTLPEYQDDQSEEQQNKTHLSETPELERIKSGTLEFVEGERKKQNRKFRIMMISFLIIFLAYIVYHYLLS